MCANEVDRLTDESAPPIQPSGALARYARQPVPPVSRYGIQHALDALCHFAAARTTGGHAAWAQGNIDPYTGWVAVTLINCDGVPLQDLLEQETQAITGAPAGGGAGG